MQGALSHIEIYVSNLNRSSVFWDWLLTEKFQYKRFQKWDLGISFKFNETYIVFVQAETEHLKSGYHRKNVGLNHLAFYCDSASFVDGLILELKEKNVNILYNNLHPKASDSDFYGVFFEDPDRIKVEIVVKSLINLEPKI